MKKDEKTKKIDPTDNPILTEFENKIEELTLGWQRCQADFQNYRRQTEEDKKRLIKILLINKIPRQLFRLLPQKLSLKR